MGVIIRIPLTLLQHTNGKAEIEVKGQSLGDCIQSLIELYPTLDGKIIDGQGNLLLCWALFRNKMGVSIGNVFALNLHNGDRIVLLPIIAGG